MALIALLLGSERVSARDNIDGGFRPERTRRSTTSRNAVGIDCANRNCIVHDPLEGKYARNNFHLVAPQSRCRCFYCETDIDDFVLAHRKSKHYETDVSRLASAAGNDRDIVIYPNAAQAESAGFSLPKRRRKTASG